MHVLYLHGFASSAQSSKARFFAAHLAPVGIALDCPDFNAPDFSTLTATRMIAQTEAMIRGLSPGPVVLIGSSLGGFVAWHVAARAHGRAAGPTTPWIDRLVLLAPAFDFGANRLRELGEDGLARWRESGWHIFFHHAYGEPRPVHYALYEDARRYRSETARVTLPTLIFQGTRDEAVDPDMVIAFAAARPTIVLRLLEGGHQLLEHLDTIWIETAAFVDLAHAR